MEHYFKQTDTSVFQNASKEEIEQEFKKFVDQVNGEIENRSEMGSGWNFNGIVRVCINVARYETLSGGT